MSEEGTPPALVRDLQRYVDSVAKSQLPVAQAHYAYLLERKDRSNDRIRTGLIVINSASLLGVLTALGTEAISSQQFGIGIGDLAFSASAFILGTMLAAAAVMVDSWRLPEEAAVQYDRVSRQENLRAALDTELNEDNLVNFRLRMEDVHALPQKDFEYSPIATVLTNFAGGAWLAGTTLPLFKIGALIDWAFL